MNFTTPLTLEYNGDERFLGDWGFSHPHLQLITQNASKFSIRKPSGNPAAEVEFPFEGLVIIRKDRVLAGDVFSAGSIIFQGKRTDSEGQADPESPSTSMEFSDPWYDLTQITFQHFWTIQNEDESTSNQYFSRINLFQDISQGPNDPWTYLTIADQIRQIVDYAFSCGANVQIGTVDPEWQMPLYAVKAVSCADALVYCLRCVADAVVYFDYQTSPPTMHVRQRPNLPSVTLPFEVTDGQGRIHKSSRIKPRYDLQPSEVVIQYQQLNEVNGQQSLKFDNDVWPLGSDGRTMGALVAPIDLRGFRQTTVEGKLGAVALVVDVSFWHRKKPDLHLPTVADLALVSTTINDDADADGIKVVDQDGIKVDLAILPRELYAGVWAPWMKLDGGASVLQEEVTVSAKIRYSTTTPNPDNATTLELHQVDNHPVSTKIRLTNATGGKHNYSALATSEQGDTIPVGLAKNIYDSLSTLQWEGEHVIVEHSIASIVGIGSVLNISGGNAAWTTMKAVINSVSIDFTSGKTTVNFGPAKHLAPGDLFELLMMWRFRQIYENPNVRNTGFDTGGAQVTMGEDTPKENTNAGTPKNSLITVIQDAPDEFGYRSVIKHDANTGQFSMGVLENDGTQAPGQSSLIADLGDLGGKEARFRDLIVCFYDDAGLPIGQGTAKVLMTEPVLIE